MRVMKYSDGWTRRHFLEQVGKGVFAAGVINPLMDVIGRSPEAVTRYDPRGPHLGHGARRPEGGLHPQRGERRRGEGPARAASIREPDQDPQGGVAPR